MLAQVRTVNSTPACIQRDMARCLQRVLQGPGGALNFRAALGESLAEYRTMAPSYCVVRVFINHRMEWSVMGMTLLRADMHLGLGTASGGR